MAAKSMKDILEGGRLKSFIDHRIIKALSHPVREHALAVFNERTASGSEIGEELGADVSLFYSHIEKLEELGCIELVETRGNRGGKERFFRAKATLMFDDQAWRRLPMALKSDITVNNVQSILDEFVLALLGGAFPREDDVHHVSWTPGVYDDVGWQEAIELMDEMLYRLAVAHRDSAARLAKSGKVGFPATIGLMGFRTAT